MSVGAVVLAAGASRRLGRPKQLVRVDDETLVERAARVAHEAGCEPVIVVIGAYSEEIRSKVAMPDVRVVVNERWQQGMASSICVGVTALDDRAEGCVLMTCDMPAVTAEHLRRLISARCLMASLYAGRCGVPAFFPRAMFPDLLVLQGDAGARELIRDAAALELADGEVDIDTEDDLRRFAEATPQT
jgi:molybdenum cofactor cytidylyltransferase